MQVALVQSPVIGHKMRGTGIYLDNLLKELEKNDSISVQKVDLKSIPDKVDIVHFTYFDPFFLTLPWFRSYKTVVTVHDLIPLKFPSHFPSGFKGSLKWYIQKTSLKKAHAIITDSISSKNDIIDILSVDPNSVYPIYLAPQTNNTPFSQKDIQKKYQLPKVFFLFVGDPNWNKNLARVIRATTKLGLALVIVSTAFAETKTVKNAWQKDLKIAQEAARDNDLIYTLSHVPVADLYALYKSAYALIYPSLYEGFGLPVVEALSVGCPVITSDRGSLKEIIGTACLIVDPESDTSICAALQKIVDSDRLRKELIHRGKKQVEKFSWEKTAHQTVAVYRNVLAS